jgi:hypothetical protein
MGHVGSLLPAENIYRETQASEKAKYKRDIPVTFRPNTYFEKLVYVWTPPTGILW